MRIGVTLWILACSGVAAGSPSVTSFEFIGAGIAGNDISADGSVVVGNVIGDFSYETFRWTRASGTWTRLGRATVPVLGVGAGAPKCSYDGTRVSATILTDDGLYATAGVWTEGSGWQQAFPPLLPDQGELDNSYASGWGLSGDGQTLTGLYWRAGQPGGSAHAFSWTPTGGAVDLGLDINADDSRANGCNVDGTVVTGWERDNGFGYWLPMAWRNGVKHLLANNPQGWCMGQEVNDDGSVIVGWSWDPANFMEAAAYWTWNGASYDQHILGVLPGTPVGTSGGWSWCDGVTSDGGIIVGTNRFWDNGPFSIATGFVWTQRTGMLNVDEMLDAAGIVLPGTFRIDSIQDITADGSTLVGVGQYPEDYPFGYHSFLIHLNWCDADMNCDGSANGIDVGLFLQAYGTQNPSADMNDDGSINGIDVGLFLQAYGQGC